VFVSALSYTAQGYLAELKGRFQAEVHLVAGVEQTLIEFFGLVSCPWAKRATGPPLIISWPVRTEAYEHGRNQSLVPPAHRVG